MRLAYHALGNGYNFKELDRIYAQIVSEKGYRDLDLTRNYIHHLTFQNRFDEAVSIALDETRDTSNQFTPIQYTAISGGIYAERLMFDKARLYYLRTINAIDKIDSLKIPPELETAFIQDVLLILPHVLTQIEQHAMANSFLKMFIPIYEAFTD